MQVKLGVYVPNLKFNTQISQWEFNQGIACNYIC